MHVPSELMKRRHWIVWKSIQRDGKATKLPFNPLTHRIASTSNPKDWTFYEQARIALETREYAGLGFVFAKDDCLFGLDLDACFVDLWNVAPWASDILRTFRTYAEVSPSATGVKVFAIGEHQRKGCIRSMGAAEPGRKRPAVEVYGWGRYFAFTGAKHVDALDELQDCREPLSRLLKTMKVDEATPRALPRPLVAGVDLVPVERARLYLRKVAPPSHSLAGCNNRTFRAACFLLHHLKLTLEQCWDVMSDWNAGGADPWNASELHRKISDAARKGHA